LGSLRAAGIIGTGVAALEVRNEAVAQELMGGHTGKIEANG